MVHSLRRSLIGYHPQKTKAFFDALDGQMASRRIIREQQLNEARSLLKQSEMRIVDFEKTLKALQADYFRLAGELSTLTARPQEMIDQAREIMIRQEEQMQSVIRQRDEHLAQLHLKIQELPDAIRALIEKLTRALQESPGTPTSPHLGLPIATSAQSNGISTSTEGVSGV